MPCALRKWASICLVPFLTFKKMGLNMPCALRKWHFLIDRFPLYYDIVLFASLLKQIVIGLYLSPITYTD